jgi:hypothetical protein
MGGPGGGTVIRPGWAILAGLVGGLSFLVVIWDAILGGFFEVSFLSTLGASIVRRASIRATYWLGAAAHIVLSAMFGLAYAWLVEVTRISSVASGMSLGAVVGVLHGAVAAAVATAVLAHIPPSLPDGGAGTEHSLGRHARAATAVWLIAHAVFGLVVGGVYLAATLSQA